MLVFLHSAGKKPKLFMFFFTNICVLSGICERQALADSPKLGQIGRYGRISRKAPNKHGRSQVLLFPSAL